MYLLTKRFFDTRGKYLKQLTKKAVGSRSKESRSPSIADRIFKQRNVLTRSSVLAKTKTQTEIDDEYKQKLQNIAKAEGRTLSEDKLKELVEENKKLDALFFIYIINKRRKTIKDDISGSKNIPNFLP